MLDKRFTSSKKVNSLSREHRYMYAAILPFLDREGRINAQPIYLKANVFLNTDVEMEEIATAVWTFANVGLIELYGHEDHAAVLEYVDFSKYNSPNSREVASAYPAYTGEMPSDTMLTSARTDAMQRTCTARAQSTLNVNENENENENEKERKEPIPPSRESSEDKFAATLNGATTANDTHRVRATIRRLHADFARRNEDSMQAWAHWTNQQIHDFWEAADPAKWPGERDKKRSWIFADLLNQDRTPPPPPYKPKTQRERYAELGILEILEEANVEID